MITNVLPPFFMVHSVLKVGRSYYLQDPNENLMVFVTRYDNKYV